MAKRNRPKGASSRILGERPLLGPWEEKINFSLRYLDRQQIPPGQTIENWNDEGRLLALYNKMRDVSQYTIGEARTKNAIHCFPEFPQNSEIRCPQCRDKKETWAELKNVGDPKCRVIGF